MPVKKTSGQKARDKMKPFHTLLDSNDSALFGNDLFAKNTPVFEVEISSLHEFKNHPFPVSDDEEMAELAYSISEYGILEPIIIRKSVEDGYEIISGHRRCFAASKLGMHKVPARIVELDDDSAITCMVDANFRQRKNIPVSSKARAYRQKFEAMKRKGKVTETYAEMGEAAGESQKTVQRMLRLSLLIDGLLLRIDEGSLGVVQGVSFSYLNEDQQILLLHVLQEGKYKPTKAVAEKIREYASDHTLTAEMIHILLSGNKPKKNNIMISADKIKQYVPDSYSEADIQTLIISLLREWKVKQNG